MKTSDLITILPAVSPPKGSLTSRVRHRANPAVSLQAWRWVRMGWLAMPLMILAGCATSPTPLSEEARAKIGRVAVQAVQTAPKTTLSVPYTRGQGAAAGALMGSGVGLLAGMGTGMDELPLNSGPPLLETTAGAAAAVVATMAAGTVVGAVAGGASGTPRRETAEGERALRQFCAGVDFQECVRREVAAEIRKKNRHPLAKGGTASTPAADSLLEIEVLEVGLEGSRSKDAKLELFLRVQTRLLSLPDGAVLYQTKARWSSRKYGLGPDNAGTVFTFNEWAGQDALLFRRYLGAGCMDMAGIIVGEIFPGEPQPTAKRSAPRLGDRPHIPRNDRHPQDNGTSSMWHRHG